MLRFTYVAALTIAATLAFVPSTAAQGVANFTIQVPVRTPGPGTDGIPNTNDDVLPISKMDVRTTVNTTGNIAFQISNPHGQTLRFPEVGTITIGGQPATRSFNPVGSSPIGDTVVVTPPPGGLAGDDPARFVYTISISTNSDYDANSCNAFIAAPENWVIAIEPGAGGTDRIGGTCVFAFDKAFPGFSCQVAHPILASGGGPLPTLPGFPSGSVQTCATARPALDAILVLDRSGSMDSPALGSNPRKKIEALRQAVKDFVNVWTGLRATEASPPADRIGLVFFDSAILWASQMGITAWNGLTQGVDELDKVVGGSPVKDLIVNNIDQVAPGGSTAMGGGILAADGKFGAGTGTNRKVVLLMSNGMQNVNPRIGIDPGNAQQLVTFNSSNPSSLTAVPNQANYQAYSVTVGTSTAVSAAINQAIATARGGFYVNSEDNPDQVRPFFLELLQNFLHFNSYEVVRMVSGTVTQTPFTTSFPLSSTTRVAAITLQFPAGRTALRLRVTPPGAPQAFEQISKTGFAVIRVDLPLNPVTNPNNDWQVEVLPLVVEAAAAPVPVDVTVVVDDLAIDSRMTIAGADFVPGQQVQLRASITALGDAVTGVGTAVVQLIRPGMSIGDLLSNNAASPTQPPGDQGTNADGKLFALLQSNPALLQRVADTLTLLDNGNAANGDERANDGIYSAVFVPQEPGHYNFLFGVEGASPAAKFSRQQLKTLNVRTEPNAANTEFTTSTQDNQLVIVATPRTFSKSKMGPGFANHIWFTAPGMQPVKPVDNLDGTYTARLPTTAGPATMHFVDVLLPLTDEVTAATLPGGGLGSGTVVVPEVPGTTAQSRLLLWLLLLLILIILILIYLYRRAHP
jgi:hypothetical protein